jgi:hypothetical protein
MVDLNLKGPILSRIIDDKKGNIVPVECEATSPYFFKEIYTSSCS